MVIICSGLIVLTMGSVTMECLVGHVSASFGSNPID